MTEAGSTERFGQPLHVHHRTPYHVFASYLDANRLENLVTLCGRCHRKADAAWRKANRTPTTIPDSSIDPFSGDVLDLFG